MAGASVRVKGQGQGLRGKRRGGGGGQKGRTARWLRFHICRSGNDASEEVRGGGGEDEWQQEKERERVCHTIVHS